MKTTDLTWLEIEVGHAQHGLEPAPAIAVYQGYAFAFKGVANVGDEIVTLRYERIKTFADFFMLPEGQVAWFADVEPIRGGNEKEVFHRHSKGALLS